MLHELWAGHGPWWAIAMFVGSSGVLIVLVIALILHWTGRL